MMNVRAVARNCSFQLRMSPHQDSLGASSADSSHYSNIEFKHFAFTVEILLVCLRTTSVSPTL